MSEFTPITTQQDFDAAISERLKRERDTTSKRYEGWTSPEDLEKIRSGYDGQITSLTKELTAAKEKQANHDKELADRDKTIRDYESRSVKTRIAHETGLPWELAERLSGEDEAAIRKDAESLLAAIGQTRKQTPPLATKEIRDGESKKAALRELANAL